MRQKSHIVSRIAIAATGGAVVALLESIYLTMRGAPSLATAISVVLFSVLGYAVSFAAIALVWILIAARGRELDDRRARAAAACIPFLVFISAWVLILIRARLAGGLVSAFMLLAAGLIIWFLFFYILRSLIARLQVLSSPEGWLSISAILLAASAAILTIEYSAGGWTWVNVPIALAIFGSAIGINLIGSVGGRVRTVTLLNIAALVLLALLPLWPQASGEALAERQGRTNVLLITVDTLRADHLGCYGYLRARTPNIDRMAREGVLFLEAIAPAPLTGPSHASILTGLYPFQHGALHNAVRLDEQATTLPEILARQGYYTAAFVSGWTLKDEAIGLAGRFHRYDDNFGTRLWIPEMALKLKLFKLAAALGEEMGFHLQRIERPAGRTTDEALRLLRRDRRDPFFLWVHYFDPHIPYAPPPPYDAMHDPGYRGEADGKWYYGVSIARKEKIIQERRDLEHMIALYDGEISYVDAEIGRLLAELEKLGLDKNTLIVFAADHGESLGEHNLYFEHSNYLYDSILKVPLILIFPDGSRSGQRVSGQARLIDIAPTIVDLLGIEAEVRFEGKSLMPMISGRETDSRPAFAAVPPGAWPSGRSIYAVRDKGYKLIWTSSEWNYLGLRVPAREELYDLRSDPQELNDLLAEGRPALAQLRQELAAWRKQELARQAPLSREAREKLRSLGYVR